MAKEDKELQELLAKLTSAVAQVTQEQEKIRDSRDWERPLIDAHAKVANIFVDLHKKVTGELPRELIRRIDALDNAVQRELFISVKTALPRWQASSSTFSRFRLSNRPSLEEKIAVDMPNIVSGALEKKSLTSQDVLKQLDEEFPAENIAGHNQSVAVSSHDAKRSINAQGGEKSLRVIYSHLMLVQQAITGQTFLMKQTRRKAI